MAAFGGRCENCEQLHKEGNYCPVCDKARALNLPQAHGRKLARKLPNKQQGMTGIFMPQRNVLSGCMQGLSPCNCMRRPIDRRTGRSCQAEN